MAVGAAALGGEAGDNHIRLELTNDADHVGEDFLAVPLRQRLLVVLGKAEIAGAGEELLRAVHAPGGEEFLCANDAQRITDLRADKILAALATRERKVGRADAATLGEVGEKLGVLVVGVGGDVEDAAAFAEGAEFLQNGRGRGRVGRADAVGKTHGDGKHDGGEGTMPGPPSVRAERKHGQQ